MSSPIYRSNHVQHEPRTISMRNSSSIVEINWFQGLFRRKYLFHDSTYRSKACGELLPISTTFSYFDPQGNSRKVRFTISDGRFRHDALMQQDWCVDVKARNRAPYGVLRTVFDLGLPSLFLICFLGFQDRKSKRSKMKIFQRTSHSMSRRAPERKG